MTTEPGSRLHDRATEPKALRFGVFEMSLRSGELRRAGRLVRIQPQPFKVLALLASRPGEVVTREEIQAEVWPAGTFVDFEQSLNFCIRQIRAALGDSALSPRYIETLPRRGYRWVGGPVERVGTTAESREWPRPVPDVPPAEETATAEQAHAVPVPPAPQPLVPAATPQGLVDAAPPERLRRPSATTLALAFLLLVTGAAAAWFALRPQPGWTPPSFQRFTFRRGLVSSARFAPDGQVVYAASWDGQEPRVHVTRADGRETRPLGIETGTIVGVSSSGDVAYQRDGTLARSPIAGGPPKDVLSDVVAADWSADESHLAVVRRDQGRFRLEFPVGQAIAEIVRPSRLRLSPDRRHVALATHPLLDDDRGAVVVYDRSGRLVAKSDGWSSLEGLAWSASGHEVWFTATRMGADNALHALALDGRVRPVLTGMGRLVVHDVAADGRVLLESATLRSEMLFRRESEREDRDLSWLDFSAAVSLSRDGSHVYFYESGQGGGPDYLTFLRGTDGSLPIRVGVGRACSLSPDGQWALSVNLGAPDRIDVIPIGPGEPRAIRVPGAAAHETAGYLPTGSTVFVTVRDAAGRRSTWLVDPDGRNPRRVPLPEGRAVATQPFSPDGTKVLMGCPEARLGPCVFPLDGGAPVPVRGGRPEWRSVGWDERNRLYFRDRARGFPEALWRVDASSGRAERIADLAPRDRAGAQGIAGVVVARTGEAWAYNVLRRLSDLHVVSGLR